MLIFCISGHWFNLYKMQERLSCIFSSNVTLAKNVWSRLLIMWNTSLSFEQMLQSAMDNCQGLNFVEKVLYASWNIWKQSNDFILKIKHLATFCTSLELPFKGWSTFAFLSFKSCIKRYSIIMDWLVVISVWYFCNSWPT